MESNKPSQIDTVIQMAGVDEPQPIKKKDCDYLYYTFLAFLIIVFFSIIGVHLYQKSNKDQATPLPTNIPITSSSSTTTPSSAAKLLEIGEKPVTPTIALEVSTMPPETTTDASTTIELIIATDGTSTLSPETIINTTPIPSDPPIIASTLAPESMTEATTTIIPSIASTYLALDEQSTEITTTTTEVPIPPSKGYNRATHYTKLDFAADEWYKPIYSLFNTPATFNEADVICSETPLTIGEVKHDQTLPSVHMYDDLINKIVEKMPAVYGGKAMWTGLFTYSIDIRFLSQLADVVYQRVYGPPNDGANFFMMNNTQSFCPPFNDKSTAQKVWNTYKVKYRKEIKQSIIRIVKDFTHSNKPKSNWPTGWFPGCLRPYDPKTDPKELHFVCQTSFLDSKDKENWRPPSQKLPFHLNRMKILKEADRRGRNFRKLPSSAIDNALPSLQLIPITNQLPTSS